MVIAVLAVVLINTTPVQNYIAHRAAKWLSGKLQTKVAVQHVRIDLLNHLALNGLYIEDKAHDTLLYAGEATVQITDWFLFKDKPSLRYLKLDNAYAHLYRSSVSKEWNYDFIEKAFATNEKKKSDNGKQFEFDLEKVDLHNVRFHMDDAWGGEDMRFDVGKLTVDARSLDIKKKLLDVKDISIKGLVISINEYPAGKPKKVIPYGYMAPVDTTPFNGGNWTIKASKVSLDDCVFRLKANDEKPIADLFDEDHLDITGITALVTDVSIIGDTIRGNSQHLYARERCGITIKDLRSKISVSPIASICEDLYLETNHSKIQNYYAMHYKRFPNFLEYIDSVTMVGHLRNATIDTRDIAYFAPELKNIPAVLQANGDGKGTVANITGNNLMVTDGRNIVKGNMTMKGLPDIYKTYITFTNAEIYTNGPGIIKYAPQLHNNPNISFDQLTHAYFKGNYEGYIDNFSVNGTLVSNLGSLTAKVKMNIPEFDPDKATYAGTIATDNLQVGMILRRDLLGSITCNEKITGKSFDRENAQITLDGMIRELNLNNYPYQNITTHGTLGKKQFVGSLLVDDRNLALEFDGGFDYNDPKNIKINASAHLLYSNLKALNLTRDSITTAADFDLNCTGSNIDNFFGYARLYNIDLDRNGRKVAVDSVYLNSTVNTDGSRQLVLESNVASANIKGNYQLTKLPLSVQYYLSRYIPNYINAPVKFPPDQNLEFTVTTKNIDSLLSVTLDGVSGFDSATLSGSFNTAAKKLVLNAAVPSGSIGRFHMNSIAINGEGNLNQIALNTSIQNVAIGDSFINSSLSLTTTLANDSLNFTIATVAPDTSTAITLNGQILARKDSLFLSILPSQFSLNRAKWDIAGGSTVVYSDKFLQVQNIALTSGLQKITANTTLLTDDQSLVINTENLDLSQFGYWAGLSEYQPDGRLNGTITIDKIFKQLYVSANMKATDVKFGADTVGTVTVIGSYDGARKLINLDPQTGIYRNNASVVASGNISFDSTTNQKLDGNIVFNNAQVAWASPFLVGIFSHMGGTVNGNVTFRGTSYNPVIDGRLQLDNAAMKLDYMGCSYTIPTATVKIDNKRISFGKMTVYDAFNNPAYVTGYFSHDLFKDMKMRLTIATDQFEVMRLTANENNMFYGNLIASMDSFTIRGPFNFIRLHAYNAAPAAKSRIFIPVSSGGTVSTYNFVSFKNYGKEQAIAKHNNRFKMDLAIEANMNDLAEMTIVLDPSAGDAITARGEGNIQLSIPPTNDMRINGRYTISEGTYDFTFKNLEYRRQFILDQGSVINFTGPFFETQLDVNATYAKKARLYDLLNESETSTSASIMSDAERADAKAPQTVNVLLHMKGTLNNPLLTFDLDLPEKRSVGTYAQTKFFRINQDDRQKLEQVGSLLLIGSFIPSDGLASGGVAGNVAKSNFGQLLSSTLSVGLTSLISKLDNKLNVDLKYNNYSFSDQAGATGINRNTVKLGVSHPFLNDKLIVEVGSTSDWGRPASASTTNSFNITGDFRVQYLLSQSNGIRLNAFRTSDYDVVQDKSITRGGAGIGYRKSFDEFAQLFQSNKVAARKRQEQLKKQYEDDSADKTQVLIPKE